jgi:hypothetical protein
VDFIYGWDSDSERFEIVTERGASFVTVLKQCRTWGEYAELRRMSWPEMIQDYELDGLSAESPFRLGEQPETEFILEGLLDPRTDAYDVLTEGLPAEIRRDPRLEGVIEWNHGSPAGHLESLEALNEDGIRLLERLAHEAGRKDYVFRRDDALIQDLLHRW